MCSLYLEFSCIFGELRETWNKKCTVEWAGRAVGGLGIPKWEEGIKVFVCLRNQGGLHGRGSLCLFPIAAVTN